MNKNTHTIAQFEIPYLRYLNPQGDIEQPVPAWVQDPKALTQLYRMMLLTRLFDKKAIALQRTGKLGTYPSQWGQEAIGVGIGAAMQKKDIFCPYYRENGTLLWRGITMEEILLYWGGDERGSCFVNNPHDFPICVPIGSQTLHAVGAAAALQYRKENNAVVTTVGDGGTSRGDFYETINVAGVWNLPVVFVINNNQWAISVPRAQQSKAQTLAQKAIAAGIDGIQIDGNDVIVVQETVAQALDKARQGKGPTVIEALTYRLGDHTTADDASRYRPAGELDTHMPEDPLIRLKKYMENHQLWNTTQEEALTETLQKEVNDATERFINTPPQPPESMFDFLYETLPQAYQSQRQAVKEETL